MAMSFLPKSIANVHTYSILLRVAVVGDNFQQTRLICAADRYAIAIEADADLWTKIPVPDARRTAEELVDVDAAIQ